MPNPVIAGAALARAIRNNFDNTWQTRYRGLQDRLSAAMEMGIQSDKISEVYGYFERPPYPERRDYGDPVVSRPFRARNFETENVSWDISVTWKQEDRLFDQLRGLEAQARLAGENFATLAERVMFQIILAAADPRLLAVIPNAPDGAPIYSATDGGGAARFGIAGGNTVTGVDFTTGQGLRDGLFGVLEQFGGFLDTEGQPAMDPGVIDAGLTVYYPITRTREFREAVQQGVTAQKIPGTGVGDEATAAGVTNVILDSGMSITLVGTSRITVDNAFCFLNEHAPKPLFEQVALPLQENVQVEENSDIARRTKEEGVFWQTIRGYGVNLPLGTIRMS